MDTRKLQWNQSWLEPYFLIILFLVSIHIIIKKVTYNQYIRIISSFLHISKPIRFINHRCWKFTPNKSLLEVRHIFIKVATCRNGVGSWEVTFFTLVYIHASLQNNLRDILIDRTYIEKVWKYDQLFLPLLKLRNYIYVVMIKNLWLLTSTLYQTHG